MLPDAGRPDHVVAAGREVAQRLHHRLRLQLVAARVAVRELLLPFTELGEPGRKAGLESIFAPEGTHLARQLGEREPQGPDDGDVRVTELSDLRRVDIEMDHLRTGREG